MKIQDKPTKTPISNRPRERTKQKRLAMANAQEKIIELESRIKELEDKA